MRFLPTKIHGILDYLYGILLIASPQLFHFDELGISDVMYALGVVVIGYSLFTRYELSIFKGIPMKGHLALDLLVGVFLMASPWLFGFAGKVYLPYVLFGAFAIVAALITKTEPTTSVSMH